MRKELFKDREPLQEGMQPETQEIEELEENDFLMFAQDQNELGSTQCDPYQQHLLDGFESQAGVQK